MGNSTDIKELIDDWVAGRRSYTNFGPHAPYTPDVVAAMDAQEVVKLATALTWGRTSSSPILTVQRQKPT